MLDIDKIKSNPHTSVLFAGALNAEAYMIQDSFEIAGRSNFNDMSEQGLIQSVANQYGSAGQVLDVAKRMVDMSTKTKVDTTATWESCDKPQFTLEILFVSTHSKHDVRKQMMPFIKGVFPSAINGSNFSVFKAPMDYNKYTDSGKFAVSIGSWFRATNQILVASSFQLSTKIMRNKTNLFARGSVTFEPHQMIFDHEIEGYFPGAGTNSGRAA